MKEIPEFEGLYSITKDGKVWSHPKVWSRKDGTTSKHDGKWMKPYSIMGYPAIVLTNGNGKRCKFLVHRLVALTYLPVPKLQVNHINGIRDDNNLKNLEWVTNTENARHAQTLPWVGHPVGEKTHCAKLTDLKVKEIRSIVKAGTHSYTQLAAKFAIDVSAISRIVNRQSWRHVE